MKITLEPRFKLKKVRALAASYSYPDDAVAIEAGQRAKAAGFYTRKDFLAICNWKSARTRPLWSDNCEQVVREVTRVVLSTKLEQLKIGALLVLRGVNWPTASVLLHFGSRARYPILDYRALWSLGNDKPPAAYTFEYWWAYTEACRRLAKQARVTMRVLDRALWQYSKCYQVGAP
jgi:hypothetical protein